MTCTFIGHDFLLDTDLPDRLLKAVEHVLCQGTEHKFLTLDTAVTSSLYGLIKDAVQEATARHPDKQVEIELIVQEKIAEDSITKAVNKGYALIKSAIERSDAVISYYYKEFLTNRERLLLERASKKLIDITSNSTREALFQAVSKLKNRDQEVLKGVNEGRNLDELALRLGINRGSLPRIYLMIINRILNTYGRSVAKSTKQPDWGSA